MEDRK
jgi:hypothetical protein